MESVPAGVIGGTFGGNALACASALKVIEIMERDHLADRPWKSAKKSVPAMNSGNRNTTSSAITAA